MSEEYNYQFKRSSATNSIVRYLFEHITEEIETAKDIGCNNGIYTKTLSELGCKVTGYEKCENTLSLGMQFARASASFAYNPNSIKNSQYCWSQLDDKDLERLPTTDLTLLLSVHHQWCANYGWDLARQMLNAVLDSTSRTLLFQPAILKSKYKGNCPEFVDNDISGFHSIVIGLFKQNKQIQVDYLGETPNGFPPSEPIRPLYKITKLIGKGQKKVPTFNSIANYNGDLVEVPMDSVVVGNTFGYADNRFHYFSKALHEIINSKKTLDSYEDSYLYKFYSTRRKNSDREIISSQLGLSEDKSYGVFPSPWADFYEQNKEPEDTIEDSTFEKCNLRHLYGPKTTEGIAKIYDDLTKLFHNINSVGYTPWLHVDGYIRGYFIEHHGNVRFNVVGGQHRIAVLNVLGYKKFIARFQNSKQKMVSSKDCENWPYVLNRFYTKKQALELTDLYFNNVLCDKYSNI